MDLELAGKRALVTGSSRGIGLGIARGLMEQGCQVILNGRDPVSLQAAADVLGVAAVVGDVTTATGAADVMGKVVDSHGALDVLVCNVGSGSSVPPGTETESEWWRVLQLNLLAATNTVAAARGRFGPAGGSILCISSICGSAELGAPTAYSAAKAALNSFVRSAARYLAKDGVRINALAPGNILFAGSVWQRKLEQDRSAVERMLASQVALGRLGTPEEVADMAAFLCSARAKFATGSLYVLDGGQLTS